jgi:hypothetical protein
MATLDQEELREVIAKLLDENGVSEVLDALWHHLDIKASFIRTDEEREPFVRVTTLLYEAIQEFRAGE